MTIDKIIDTTCEVFNVSRAQLMSRNRSATVSDARCVAIELLCQNELCYYSEIAELFKRDRTTINASRHKFNNVYITDKTFNYNYNKIIELITQTMGRHLESQLQIQCVRWFRYQYSQYEKILFAVPNGGNRNKLEAGIMKTEGVTAGVSDLILLLPRQGFNALCVEMKIDDGKQTQNQKEWQKEAEKHGSKYVICRTFEEFETIINWYLKK